MTNRLSASVPLSFFLASFLATLGCGVTTDDRNTSAARFVAVGAEGTILSSSDGVSWTAESSSVTASLISVAASPSLVVAVGSGGTILTSPDGRSWTRQESPTTVDLTHVIFTGEELIAVGGSWESGAVTLKSSDGVLWTLMESPADYMFHAAAHGDGKLVVAAYYRSDLMTPALFTADVSSGSSLPDGWEQREGPDFYDSLTVDDEIMVVGGERLFTSFDGVDWRERPLPSGRFVTGIAASDSTFVIVGEGGAIYRSDDAAEWSEPETEPGSDFLAGVSYGGSSFVAVGGNGAILTSSDAALWTPRASGTSLRLSDVAYGPAAAP